MILDIRLDIILGIIWLSLYNIVLNYNAKILTLDISRMDKLEWEGVYKDGTLKLINFIHANKVVGKGVHHC